MSAKDKIILPLDVSSTDQAVELVRELKDCVGAFKVGLELFTSIGPRIFDAIRDAGAERIFFDGKFHDVDSSEMAFKIAGSMCFQQVAREQCKPALLEPIMTISVTIPETYMGDVMGDLNSRRGRVLGMDPKNGKQIIKALVPLAEMYTYAIDLRSITQGRGSFEMAFSHYEQVPHELAEKIVAESKMEVGAEE